ncbi:hypothetical protein ED733_004427 [Metarhizium rileyi]|uniref:Uncharacterized protein n=1 Tax=Metarhizium rileyi (strain RCEF 4871) TaxID=1649241 RepID=A0A5C6GFM2_METRR|nr:hypothetical protein ED733_004427 [Metarhizium rileyi]
MSPCVDEVSPPSKQSNDLSQVATLAKISVHDARLALQEVGFGLKAQMKTGAIDHDSSLSQLPSIKELANRNLPDSVASIWPHRCSAYPVEVSGLANDPYHEAKRTLDELRALIKDYEEASKHETNIKMPVWVRWEQDGVDLRLLNSSLLRHAMKQVEINIMPSTSKSPPHIGHDDVDQIAWELLADTWSQKMGETWGDAAEGILRSLLGVSGFLP